MGFFGSEGFFILLAIVYLLVVPIIAIAALVRVNRLARRRGDDDALLRHIEELTQRVTSLERQISTRGEAPAAPSATAIPRPSPATPPPPIPSSAPVKQAPPPQGPEAPLVITEAMVAKDVLSPGSQRGPVEPKGGIDLEALIGGRWLNYAGILALLFAVAFFIKYAFENNWVGPRGRIAIGLLIGASLVVWSQGLLRRGYRFFSEGMAGLGAAVLYLSLWAGWHYYQFFSQAAAFAFMAVVTAVMVLIAVGRNSERVAVLAVVGGLLTPILVSTGHDQELILFSYLAVLGAGLLAIAWAKNWRFLGPIQFAGTLFYFWGWWNVFYTAEKQALTALFAIVFFVLFAGVPVIRSLRLFKMFEEEIGLVLVNAGSFLLALHRMLWPDQRWTFTLAVLGLSAAHTTVVRFLPRRSAAEGKSVKLVFASLALVFATLVVPIRLDGKWITMGLALEGAVLVWSGLREKVVELRTAGLLLFVIVGWRLVSLPIPAPQPFWNARFATFAVSVACFAITAILARRQQNDLREGERNAIAVLAIAANIYALAALSLETWDWSGRMPSLELDRWLAQQLALSLLWTVYAIGLIIVGIRRSTALLRWEALILLGVVVAKVFFWDLSSLDRIYRVVSFSVVGLVLLRVSFYYQKRIGKRAGGVG